MFLMCVHLPVTDKSTSIHSTGGGHTICTHITRSGTENYRLDDRH